MAEFTEATINDDICVECCRVEAECGCECGFVSAFALAEHAAAAIFDHRAAGEGDT